MPSGGPTIAKAYVAIIPTTKDAQKNISKTLIPDLSSAGEAGGTAMSGGISGALKANAGKIATLAKVALAGVGIAAVKKFTEDVVGAFSDWEQLAGGAEAIFSQLDMSSIVADAQSAYKTLGISANEYMESMTSVGATLAKTLGQQEGYDTAKLGLSSLADLSAGTGRSMDELMDKYQLITRTSTQYLSIADQFSGVLPQTNQAFIDAAYSAGYLSERYEEMSQIPLAEYQKAVTNMIRDGVGEMGMLGRASQEASTTLAGSANMMKASWKNLQIALGTGSYDEISRAVASFAEGLTSYLSNLVPRIGMILSGIVSYLPTLASDIIAALPGFVSSIMTSLMDMIAATPFGPAISELLNSEEVVAAFSAIKSAWDTIIGSIDTTTLSAAFDALLSAGTYISGLLSDLGAVVIDIVNGIMVPIIQGLWSFVSDHIIPGLSKLGDDMQPLLTVTLDFLAKIFEWIRVLADGLITIIKPAIEIVFKIMGPVFTKIFEWLGILFKWIGDFLTEVWAEFEPLMSLVIKYAGELFKWLGAQLQEISNKFDIVVRIISTIIRAAGERAWQVVSTVVGTIIGTVSGIVGNIQRIMGNIMAAVWNVLSGIGSAVWSLVNGIYNAASYITNALTSPFIEAFRQIKRLWNNTIGRMSFNIPSWVPGIGGSSFSMPQLANGGTLTSSGTVMVGEAGPEILTLPRGARVTPLSSEDATTGGTTYSVVVGNVDLSDDDQVRRVTREYLEFLARMATPGGLSMSHRSA